MLTTCRELGSKESYIRGNPLINKQFIDCEAVVVEQAVSAKYTKYLRRPGKGPGDRKWRKRSYRDDLTVLRITNIDVRLPEEQQK